MAHNVWQSSRAWFLNTAAAQADDVHDVVTTRLYVSLRHCERCKRHCLCKKSEASCLAATDTQIPARMSWRADRLPEVSSLRTASAVPAESPQRVLQPLTAR
jgi:hypothetical protein